MTIADRLLDMYIYPWFPPGRTCPDDKLPVREALYAAHAAATAGDDVSTIMHMRRVIDRASEILWYALRDHASEFVERFDVYRIAQYDQATREQAEAWVAKHHKHVEPGQAFNRLIADACAHIHLATAGKWKP